MSNTRPIPYKSNNSKFINNTDIKLKDKLSQIVNSHTQNISYLDFLIGYFQISGFKHLNDIIKNKLDSIKEMRILVGIDLDQIIAELLDKNIDFSTAKKDRFIKQFVKEQVFQLNNDENYLVDTDDSICQLLEAIKSEKIKMRIIRERGVHAKFYILSCEPQFINEVHGIKYYDYKGSVIIGSSNLSHNGLVKHYEFNAELRDSQDIETALYEFNQLWEKSIEISVDDIGKIEKESYLSTLSPQEIYYKLLIEYFGRERIEVDRNVEALFPKGYKILQYQIDAILDGINKLDKYNGVFLSDVVGLGKTLIATIIMRKMEMMSKFGGHILVVCPPALKTGWKEHFQLVGCNRNYEIISQDQLHRIANAKDYGLIIVDESHRFKSSTTQRYKELERICKDKSLYVNKKVILLSATPQNNSPEDIKNQIYLFQDSRHSNIGSQVNLDQFFGRINKQYKQIKDDIKMLSSDYLKNSYMIECKRKELRGLAITLREEVLKYIMIRRTRGDIQKGFPEDIKEMKFPKIQPIVELEYQLSPEAEELSRQTLALLDLRSNNIGKYGYYRYLIYPHLTTKGKNTYRNNMDSNKDDNFYNQTAERLRGLMKTLLFKRFESSIFAFVSTLDKQIRSITTLLNMLESNQEIIIPKDNLSNLESYYSALESGDEAEFDEFIEQYGDRIMCLSKSDFQENFTQKLQEDSQTLRELKIKWETIQEDAKLQRLIQEIKNHQGEKLLIFTEAKTTAKYLNQKLKDVFENIGILQVDSDNRKNYEQQIRKNFDANYQDQEDEYQILISTDTLAEGVNMHRSNIIINYDAPWNATRLMQRAGRINRLGTKHTEIYPYNFKPSHIGDEILSFSKQIFQKLQSFHYTLGEDSTIYSEIEEMGSGGLLSFNEGESADPEVEFLKDIRKLREENTKEFERIAKIPLKARTFFVDDDVSYFYFKQIRQEKIKDKIKENINDFFYSLKAKKGDDLFASLETSIQRVKFEDMASYLRDRVGLPICEKAVEKHYIHAQQALKYHAKELQIHNKQSSTLLSLTPTTSNALRAVKNNTSITQEERELLIDALNKGKLNTEEEKQIIKEKDLQVIIEIARRKTHDNEAKKSESKVYYPKPTIQLSSTAIKQ